MIQTYRLIHAKAARSRIRIPRVWSWHIGLKPKISFRPPILAPAALGYALCSSKY